MLSPLIIGTSYLTLNILSYFVAKYINQHSSYESINHGAITVHISLLLLIAPFGSVIYVLFHNSCIDDMITNNENVISKEKINENNDYSKI